MVALANQRVMEGFGGDGWFLLRIDDTDRERSDGELVEQLIDDLKWLGISWDDGPVFQAPRDSVYSEHVDKLLGSGDAYECFCGEDRLAAVAEAQRKAGKPPRYDGQCRTLSDPERERLRNLGQRPVVRLRVPSTDVNITDLVHGEVITPAESFGDYVIRRADGTATYMLASVVDDVEFKVGLVIRGSDHLANAARQAVLFDALGAERPVFAHLPVLLNPMDGRKLAKRDKAGSLHALRQDGWSPAAISAWAFELLGQHEPGFDFSKVPRGTTRVDLDRLASIGRETMAAADVNQLLAILASEYGIEAGAEHVALVEDVRSEAATLKELAHHVHTVIDQPDAESMRVWVKGSEHKIPVPEALQLMLHAAGDDPHAMVVATRALATERSVSPAAFLRPLRVALTGTPRGPGMESVLTAIGMSEVHNRIQRAITALSGD
jgi:glutamyl-tRNA synthetase